MKFFDWEYLFFFLVVVCVGNLCVGVVLFNVNYGIVNCNIQVLEVSYGVCLFDCLCKGFVLIDVGESFVLIVEELECKVILVWR